MQDNEQPSKSQGWNENLKPLYLLGREIIRTDHSPPLVALGAIPGCGATLIWNYLRGFGYLKSEIGNTHGTFDTRPFYRLLLYRDLRDALCSTVARIYYELWSKGKKEEALLTCLTGQSYQNWIGALHYNLSLDDVTRIRFEDYYFGNEGALIDFLAARLHLNVSPKYKEYLLWEFSLERNKQRADWAFQRGGWGEVHRPTEIHGGHISSGKHETWKETFTPQVTEVVKQAIGDLLIELGYERNMDW